MRYGALLSTILALCVVAMPTFVRAEPIKIEVVKRDKPVGFAIAGSDKKFVWADANRR